MDLTNRNAVCPDNGSVRHLHQRIEKPANAYSTTTAGRRAVFDDENVRLVLSHEFTQFIPRDVLAVAGNGPDTPVDQAAGPFKDGKAKPA